ncbi:putative transcriptional regulator [Cylindrospermum stagnale PCC 7417]|uniref:Putative transcriptional regulator n=1 Tax=Cylindrospermum stagnale PCC 7417 TaxID=56107 RepID=K9WWW3_9NOST|nr:transcriptional regulator [Cylindrospermum stagnale]AFZ24865.1 putative transcriptional regulator [Cylindrospermum stagnale PCC 7417]
MPQTQQKSVTFRTEAAKLATLDALSESLGRDRTSLLNEALDAFIEVQTWHKREIMKALEEVRRGEVISEEEMDEFFKELVS